jgi:inosine-uridine nucleoside N-ribohydrolase
MSGIMILRIFFWRYAVTYEQRIKNLSVPAGKIDVVLDTDAYNEIDDQFAIAYMLKNPERLDVKAIYAAPFLNARSTSAGEGMEKSYNEIFKLLDLMKTEMEVFRGSDSFLADEKTPVISDAARDLAARVENYSPENPLYVVAIGAITNVASALLLNPKVAENAVLVWLGGHGFHFHDTKEFNMVQDIAASRVVMSSGIPFVQLPCMGVVSSFTVSKPELEYWLKGKNPLADYLATNTIDEAESYAHGKPWTRVIWDVTAVAWLLNDNNRFMLSSIVKTPLSSYEGIYEDYAEGEDMRYVYYIHRDRLMEDLFAKILHE